MIHYGLLYADNHTDVIDARDYRTESLRLKSNYDVKQKKRYSLGAAACWRACHGQGVQKRKELCR